MATAYAAAWSSHKPESVAAFYEEDGRITINKGDPVIGRAAFAETAAGFYQDFPDLIVRMDEVRLSGNHALFAWTLEGHHSQTANHVKVSGWEEWTLSDAPRVIESFGWFDAEDYQRQIDGA
ncbi:MAG: nuclear transport factor 2 family protein [Pseudomonadota bacterium]